MPGTPLADEHNVLRYVAPRHVDNGLINGSGFLRRPQEVATSVNWMEGFAMPIENQVSGVRSVRRLTYARNGRLAQISVGGTRRYVEERAGTVFSFRHDP